MDCCGFNNHRADATKVALASGSIGVLRCAALSGWCVGTFWGGRDEVETVLIYLRFGAGNRTRTGDPQLGKLMLYQLSYSRS